MPIMPEVGTEVFNRSGFAIHGGTISHGCIILPPVPRIKMSEIVLKGDNALEVTA